MSELLDRIPSRCIASYCRAALVLLAISGLGLAELAGEETDKVFVGYVFRQPDQIHFERYTHLCHAFLVADGDGNILPRRGVPNRELTEQAHLAGTKVLLSLGGWGWDEQFGEIVATPEKEDRYVKRVMQIVADFGYDGIDLDWEYPDTKSEVLGFERLVRRFRSELDGLGAKTNRHLFQTMAASANPGTLKWLSNEILLETMDWVNVMTYDYTGDWTDYAGHHSPLFASSKQPGGESRSTELTMKYLVEQRGFPADRLAVGIPLYGRGFAASEPYSAKQDAAGVGVPRGSYSNLYQLLQAGEWTRQWDDETKNPWLISPDGSVVVGYDDERSIALKTDWAMQHGFRGVFFWQIAADQLPDGRIPLQEAAHEAWAKHTSAD